MTENQLCFRPVIHLVVFTWKLKLETPMLIRSSYGKDKEKEKDKDKKKEKDEDKDIARWSHCPKGKSRGTDMTFSFYGGNENDNKITLPYFGLEIEGNQAVPKYRVPVSSIRGSLRNWTIRQLVKSDDQAAFVPQKKEGKSKEDQNEYKRNQIKLANEKKSGWPYINNLFGFALDTTKAEGDQSSQEPDYSGKAGRLRFSGGELADSQEEPGIQGNWKKDGNAWDPQNALRHIKIRNPIDRITMASKEGGLHSFIEFSPGMEFEVTIELREPEIEDLFLFAVIKREINEGMLRFGALSSVGRGRVQIIEDSSKKYSMKKSFDSTAIPDDKEILAFLYDIEEIKLKDYINMKDKVNFYE